MNSRRLRKVLRSLHRGQRTTFIWNWANSLFFMGTAEMSQPQFGQMLIRMVSCSVSALSRERLGHEITAPWGVKHAEEERNLPTRSVAALDRW
jgi:hypothetical protein